MEDEYLVIHKCNACKSMHDGFVTAIIRQARICQIWSGLPAAPSILPRNKASKVKWIKFTIQAQLSLLLSCCSSIQITKPTNGRLNRYSFYFLNRLVAWLRVVSAIQFTWGRGASGARLMPKNTSSRNIP